MNLLAFVSGCAFVALLLVPLWLHDQRRDAARIDELLHLLEAQAAPAEFFAVAAPSTETVSHDLIWSEDGLVSVQAT